MVFSREYSRDYLVTLKNHPYLGKDFYLTILRALVSIGFV